MMQKTILLIIACFQFCLLAAQKEAPKWIDKGRKAILSVTTYDKEDRKIATTNGFFVTETGEALSAYTPFKGATRGIVVDFEGKEYPITAIVGADELYDVVKFKVSVPKKVSSLSIASAPIAVETNAYLLSYSTEKKPVAKQGKVVEVSKLKDAYSYYKVSIPLEMGEANAPILSPSGDVFGLAQEDASGKKGNSYAVSAAYVNSLHIASTDAFSAVYNNIGIRKVWPAEVNQAAVSLMLMASTQDAKTYLETINDFIATFPNSADGYLTRSSHYANNKEALASTPAEQMNLLNKALEDINTAAKYNNKPSDAYYSQAKLIYNIAITDTTITDKNWTIEAAMNAVQKAIQIEDLPLFRQLEGDIYFSQGEYQKAFDNYMIVNSSDLASTTTYYWAAKAKENIQGANISEIIALLDSAVAKFGTSTPREAGPYILERIELKLQLSQFKEAIEDYDLYYYINNGQVGDAFYYYREQAKFRLGDNAGALQDIQEAIKQDDQSPDYYAEEAAVYVRLQEYDKALNSVQKALALAPDFASCYRLRGVCLVRQKKNTEACDAFKKAKELGDPLVDKLMKEHCK